MKRAMCVTILAWLLSGVALATAADEPYIQPWTPPTLQGETLGCWGRSYAFHGSLLPSAIVSQGEDLLAGPMELALTLQGQPQPWQSVRFTPADQDREAVRGTTEASTAELAAQCRLSLEFDGMLRVDLRLVPQQPVTVDTLDLLVPLKSIYAEFFHHHSPIPLYEWDWMKRQMNAGRLGDAGLKLPFVFHLWLGNDDRGVQFFSESDEALAPADPAEMVTVTRQGPVTLLRLRLLSHHRLDGPWQWTFGLMATPVKPWPADYHRIHYCQEGGYGIEQTAFGGGPADAAHPTYLDILKQKGVTHLCFHEEWSMEQSLPRPADPAKLKSLLDACRQRDIAFVPYTGTYLSPRSPEYRPAWDTLPLCEHYLGKRNDNGDPLHIVCNGSPNPDLLWKLYPPAFQEYGFGGIYSDGLASPVPCSNAQHGCGYQGRDGQRHVTMPIWRTRALMKRLYRLVKTLPEPGISVAHMSGSALLPALSFADVYVDGEHLLNVWKIGTPEFSEDILRAEMWGHSFGIPATTLPTGAAGPEQERARTVSALYDIQWMWHSWHTADLWRAFDAFDVDGAAFVPFWKMAPLVTCDDAEHFRASGYLQRGRGILLVVANLGTTEATTSLTVDRAALGLASQCPLQARNEVEGALLPMSDRVVRVTVPAHRFQMISVQARP